MPRDYNIFSQKSSKVLKVVLAMCVLSSLCWLVPVTHPCAEWLLSWWELFMDFCSQSPGVNTSEHKARGSGSLSPMTHGDNLWLLLLFVLMCLAVWHFLFAPSVFPLSMPSRMVFLACSPFLFYHCKIGKAEWSKIGDGNSPSKGWEGTKKRKPDWTERHSMADGHTAPGIYPHL